jgi:hypothetical protein
MRSGLHRDARWIPHLDPRRVPAGIGAYPGLAGQMPVFLPSSSPHSQVPSSAKENGPAIIRAIA